jgi:hypothetical protein
MKEQILSPGMQHRGDSDSRAETFLVFCEFKQCCGRGIEKDFENGFLISECERIQIVRNGEYDMKMRRRQHAFQSFGKPFGSPGSLTFRTMPVAAGIVRDARESAPVFAFVHMSAEHGRTTCEDIQEHFALCRGRGVQKTIFVSMGTHHVRDLQSRSLVHCPRSAENFGRRRTEQIERAYCAGDAQNTGVGIHHRRAKIRMSEQCLHRGDIASHVDKVRGEAVPKRMRRYFSRDTGSDFGFPKRYSRGFV